MSDSWRRRAREAFTDEAIQAWAEYLETGLHLSVQEVPGWLESWGTAAETDLPALHA